MTSDAQHKRRQRREYLFKCPEDELEGVWNDCQQLAIAIIDHWPNRTHEHTILSRDPKIWLKQFADELARFDDPELVERFIKVISARDSQTNLDQFVMNSLRSMQIEEVFPLLCQSIKFNPPPNEYGIHFLQGLATRDVNWLRKLAKDKKHGGLSSDQLYGLLSIATDKLCNYLAERAQQSRNRSQPPTESWIALCQAVVTANSDRLSDLLELADQYPTVFDFRSFQVPSAVKLCKFAATRHGQLPAALVKWSDRLKARLVDATSEEPQPPDDFQRRSETGCECEFCQQLIRFLADPLVEQTEIPAAKHDRNHLVDMIRSRRLDVETKTIKTGSPHSLGLTKTTASHQAEVSRYHSDLKLRNKMK